MFIELQEGTGTYQVEGVVSENDIIAMSTKILESKVLGTDFITCPNDTKKFLRHKLQGREQEVFAVLLLSNRHQIIEYKELFFGTIDGASVYPREVAKYALQKNASAMVITHNHPSGIAEPSQADEKITYRLKDVLALFDIRLLDHFIIGGSDVVSLAERGLI